MKVLLSLVVVLVLFFVGYGGGAVVGPLFGIVIPYIAVLLFLVGFAWRVLSWANVPVPFRIPTTCGQQKSLPWIKDSKVDNPSTGLGVVVRMAFEVLFFRSLMRNTNTELRSGGRLSYGTNIFLWLGAMAFHWSMFAILVRHLRLFVNPVPFFVNWVEMLDGFIEFGVPVFYASSVLFIMALGWLLVRRLYVGQVRYISLANDYFPLFLLLGIGVSGFWLRHLDKTDISAVKQLAAGLFSFSPSVPDGISGLFFGHLFLVCILIGYFPFSKLMHMAGVFLSPTRNMANTNRMVRHINPWDYEVKTHSYEEYEDEWREKMKGCGLPVDKE